MIGKTIAMDSPWIMFGLPDKSHEYFALLSCLPLNKYRAIPGFLRFSSQIQKQLRATPGVIGYSLRAKLLSRNFWTLSAWADEKALTDFVAKIPHEQAMQAMMPHMGPTKFTKWKVLGSALPLRWEEVIPRSKKGGPT
jgi:quinol monooxygenase YgiN